jgi:hypothetical protein
VQNRERILLFGLIGVVAAWVLLPALESVLLAPFSTKLAEITELEDSVAAKEKEENRLLLMKGDLSDWARASLPPEPQNAQRVYQEWLVDLARLAGFRNISPAIRTATTRGRSRSDTQSIYTEVPVILTAEGTLRQLATFLYHFDRADVLQRLDRCDIVSTETEGDPLLNITITATGLSLPTAEGRVRLFPRGELTAAAPADATQISVIGAEAFPKEGEFRIRIGSEFARVTEQKAGPRDNLILTVERGVSGTKPAAHKTQAVVELAPERDIADPTRPADIAGYEEFLKLGPFAKPRPPIQYNPRLAELEDQTLIRGRDLEVSARVTSWDPADGTAVFALGEGAPEGMTISEDGDIAWSPNDDIPAGDYNVRVEVTATGNAKRQLSGSFEVELQDINQPPRLTLPQSVEVAYIGRIWTAEASASDPDQSGRLKYALSGQSPAGATIDASTGKLRWEPADDTEPGDVTFTIEVADGGDPEETDSDTLTVSVEDDAAEYTYLVGCIQQGDEWLAWLYDRSNNTSRYLRVGSKFQVADISGEVVAIELRSMEFVDALGRWRLDQEQPLRRAAPLALTATEDSNDAAGTPANASEPEATNASESESTGETEEESAVNRDNEPIDTRPADDLDPDSP